MCKVGERIWAPGVVVATVRHCAAGRLMLDEFNCPEIGVGCFAPISARD